MKEWSSKGDSENRGGERGGKAGEREKRSEVR